jgi:hypothetical protein
MELFIDKLLFYYKGVAPTALFANSIKNKFLAIFKIK